MTYFDPECMSADNMLRFLTRWANANPDATLHERHRIAEAAYADHTAPKVHPAADGTVTNPRTGKPDTITQVECTYEHRNVAFGQQGGAEPSGEAWTPDEGGAVVFVTDSDQRVVSVPFRP